MTCLPLLSFSPSIPAVFRPYDSPPVFQTDEEESRNAVFTPPATPEDANSPYDKLSQVSVSHRRVDSFEWVMTQSAPNTPPTMSRSSRESFSPPPARLIASAPLPVPNETWSTAPIAREVKEKRGYFDWWSSPSLSNDKGYAQIPRIGEPVEQIGSSLGLVNHDPCDRPSRTFAAHVSMSPAPRVPSTIRASPSKHSALSPSEELNALGITFPDTPPPSPSRSGRTKSFQTDIEPSTASDVSPQRLPKRVSFSPIIDEVAIEPWSKLESLEYQGMSWGNYLPSSFLVARPPLPRVNTLPATRGKRVIRPILRRQTPLHPESLQGSTLDAAEKKSTEMRPLSSKQCAEGLSSEMTNHSSMPTERLSMADSIGHEHGHSSVSRAEADRLFVSLFQVAQKPARRRCDSIISTTSSTVSGNREEA